MSLASITRVKEKDSPGAPRTARGLVLGPSPVVCAGVQVCVIVSGLNWKRITFGAGIRNVCMNSTNAPWRNFPAIRPLVLRQLPPQFVDNQLGQALKIYRLG